jgi:hypothetical protein
MTPLDKAREALAAVEKATAGTKHYSASEIAKTLEAGIRARPELAKFHETTDYAADGELFAAAVNFVRADLPALIASIERREQALFALEMAYEAAMLHRERLADRVAKLEGALERLAYAASNVCNKAVRTYAAKNGRQVSIEADNGEACDIVESEYTHYLAAAVQVAARALATPGGEE